MSRKKWNIAVSDKQKAREIAEECGADPFLTLILIARGFDTPDKIKAFFDADENMGNPFELADMKEAAERVNRAVDDYEKILVYGDYDVDGISATVLLYSYLADRGANVLYYIPGRDDGYGMSRAAVDKIKEQEVSLIITVDNGITAVDEIKYAAECGIDVVVTDHHLPGDELPPAVAAVDPCRSDCQSVFKGLAGVGVAYKLVCAAEGCSCGELLYEYSDLIALGTVADLMPLTGENRIFVKHGLENIRTAARPGLAALMHAAGIDATAVTSDTVSYYIAPRINAAGRMGDSSRAAAMLLEEDEDAAMHAAEELCSDNTSRRETEHAIAADAVRLIEEKGYFRDRVIVAASDKWPQGVIGIAASRIVEKYGVPTILLSIENGEAVGSGRSIRGFNLHDCIQSAGELLMRFGGHELAAGVTVREEDIDELRRRVNDYARINYALMPFPSVDIDCRLTPAGACLGTVNALKELEPFGSGNKRPVFGMMGVCLDRIQSSSDGRHIKLFFSRGNVTFSLMKFNTTLYEFEYDKGDILDIAVTLNENRYNGKKYFRINLIDIRPSGVGGDEYFRQIRAYECFCRGEETDISEDLVPDRQDIARLYRFARSLPQSRGVTEDMLCVRLGMTEQYCKVMLSADILAELGLVNITRSGGRMSIHVNETEGKTELEKSVILQKLRRLCAQ